jgi:hypothetical protein
MQPQIVSAAMMSAVSSVWKVLARHRTIGMAYQSGDGHLGKTEIVGDTREAVT